MTIADTNVFTITVSTAASYARLLVVAKDRPEACRLVEAWCKEAQAEEYEAIGGDEITMDDCTFRYSSDDLAEADADDIDNGIYTGSRILGGLDCTKIGVQLVESGPNG